MSMTRQSCHHPTTDSPSTWHNPAQPAGWRGTRRRFSRLTLLMAASYFRSPDSRLRLIDHRGVLVDHIPKLNKLSHHHVAVFLSDGGSHGVGDSAVGHHLDR